MKRVSQIVLGLIVISISISGFLPAWADTQTPKSLMAEGIQMVQRGAIDEAEKTFEKVISMAPSMAGSAHFQIAVVYAQHQRLNYAIAHYEKALDFNPKEAMIYANLANAYLTAGLFEKATETYNRLIAIDPNQAWPHYNLGNLYLQRRLFPQAIESFNRAIAIDSSKFRDIYEKLGYAYQILQAYDRAAQAHRKALEKNPKSFNAAYNLGICYYRLNEFDKSIAACQQAIALQPKSAEAITNLGLAYHANKQYKEAEAAFVEALAIKPHLGEALFGMALVYREREEYAKALDYAQKAIDSGKKISPDFIDRLKAKSQGKT